MAVLAPFCWYAGLPGFAEQLEKTSDGFELVESRGVRLDKYMKVSRLARRRSEAHEALEHGRITKDGKPLKPGYQVRPGDELAIHYASRLVTVRVREVPLRMTPSVKPAALYEVLATAADDPEWE